MNTKYAVILIWQYQEWYGEEDHSSGRWKNKGSFEQLVMESDKDIFGVCYPDKPFCNEFARHVNPTEVRVTITNQSRADILEGYDPYDEPHAFELSLHANCTEYESQDAISNGEL